MIDDSQTSLATCAEAFPHRVASGYFQGVAGAPSVWLCPDSAPSWRIAHTARAGQVSNGNATAAASALRLARNAHQDHWPLGHPTPHSVWSAKKYATAHTGASDASRPGFLHRAAPTGVVPPRPNSAPGAAGPPRDVHPCQSPRCVSRKLGRRVPAAPTLTERDRGASARRRSDDHDDERCL